MAELIHFPHQAQATGTTGGSEARMYLRARPADPVQRVELSREPARAPLPESSQSLANRIAAAVEQRLHGMGHLPVFNPTLPPRKLARAHAPQSTQAQLGTHAQHRAAGQLFLVPRTLRQSFGQSVRALLRASGVATAAHEDPQR